MQPLNWDTALVWFQGAGFLSSGPTEMQLFDIEQQILAGHDVS